MPIHLKELDVVQEVEGIDSILIVACTMCAGASLAMRDQRPFLQFFTSLLKSPPLERHIRSLRSILRKRGVKSKVFRGGVIQQFFLCLWTARQRHKLQACAKKYDGVIVLGCDSAIETVRETVEGVDCHVIKGMQVAGIMNTKPKFHLSGNLSFEYSRIIPICDQHCKQLRTLHAKESRRHVG
ncbi:hypothetical protein ACFL6U_24760 [Planctomycetota bacterium]